VSLLQLFIPLAAAAVLSAGLVFALNRLAKRIGAVARVSDDRWHRTESIPHLAGPGLLAAMAPWFPLDQALILGAVCAIGCVDDIYHLPPWSKALLMLAPAAGAWWVTGSPWAGVGLWFVANAANLLDHADGLAASAAGVAFLFAGTPASLAAAGACIGFLFYNYPPAKSFMGDGGSLMLGAALILVWQPSGLLVTGIWCAVPLLDAVFVTFRRVVEGRKPWIGGKDHTGHILMRAGVPDRLLPLIYALAAAGIGYTGQHLAGAL